ncbi:hypothetical protein HYV31_00880 [candidate division WWE3 bacterium]|nr:hypothetical protein [candidate division WWE3 bacterium]
MAYERNKQIEEAFGNFKNIFNQPNLTIEAFLDKLNQTAHIIQVSPLDYFKNVGNGMNPDVQMVEIEKITPSSKTGPIERAQIAISYIKNGNHIGVSDEQYAKDLDKGKNHDATMLWFLEKIISSEPFDPCVVVLSNKANQLYGEGVNKVILDGTHRAVIAALVNQKLSIMEFSVD